MDGSRLYRTSEVLDRYVPGVELDFGAWTLDVAGRQLRLHGKLQEVEPKAFDLLVFLIEQRRRVVRSGELLHHVWAGAVVSDNVIPRTVMKARRAIGDKADETSAIRTVHRIGYRFVGEPVQRAETAPPESVASPAQAGPGSAIEGRERDGALRLGLLPFENLTGDPQMAWLEQGLATLVVQALDLDPRLSVMPIDVVAATLSGAAGNTLLEPRGRTVERLLGLHCVVHTYVHRDGDGYRAEYRAIGKRSRGAKGSLTGAEPTELGQRLAERIEAELFPDRRASVLFQSDDAYANQTFARAMQARGEERWHSAAKLLEVVLDIEPHSTVAACQHLSMLAALYDPAALALGDRLLGQALAAGDSRFAATVHQALAHAHLNIHGPQAESQHHADEALRLAGQHGAADWVVRVYTTQARHEGMKRNYPRARELYEQAAHDCEATGNRIELAKIMNNRAVIDALTGNLLGAREWMEESLRISEELHLDSNVAVAGGNLAQANAELGFLGRATDLCDMLVDRVGTLQDGRLAAGLTVTVCGIYAARRALAPIDRAIGVLRRRPAGVSALMQPFLAMAEGHRHAACGDPGAARACMAEGVRGIGDQGDALMLDQWLALRLDAELRAGSFDAAHAVVDDIRALPAFSSDDKLHGLVLRAHAVALHAVGDRHAALAGLLQALQLIPVGRWNAHVRLDAAWLHLECGDPASARQLVRDIAPWLDEHPAGWLTQARLKGALGLWADACALQQRFIECVRPVAVAHPSLLCQLYALGARGGTVNIPFAPRLPTLW